VANFTRVKPLGWGLFDILASALMNAIDINLSKAVNGDEGGTWAGPVTLTNGRLTGTSFVNTSGQVTTTGAVTGATVNSTGDTNVGADLIAASAVKSPIALVDKLGPRTISEQTVDSELGAAPVTLDLTSYQTFIVNCAVGGPSGADEVAILGTITLTTATGDADREVKKGATWKLIVRANGHASGCRISSTAWPASIVGLEPSDKRGPGGQNGDDLVTYVFEQVGTPGVPKFAPLSVTYGAS